MDIRASAASMSPAAKHIDWIPEKCSSTFIVQFWEKNRNLFENVHLRYISLCVHVCSIIIITILNKHSTVSTIRNHTLGLIFSTVAFHLIPPVDERTNCSAYTNSHTTLIGPS